MTAAWRLIHPALLAIPPLMVLAAAALTPTDQLFPNQGDLNLYLEKAAALADGRFPYRDLPLEYPPLALVPMAVPYLVGALFGPVDLDLYKWLFAGWEAALLLVLGAVVVRVVRLLDPGAADGGVGGALRLIVLSAGAVLAITFRFDLFPALLMAAGLWLALERRPAAAGVAIGLGVLAKLFPIAILPALAVPWLAPRVDLRGLVRLGAGVAVTVAVGLLPFVLVAGADGTFQFLRYNAERGLQIESTGGGFALLYWLFPWEHLELDFGFSSVNVESAFARGWLELLPLLTFAGFGLVAWLGWRRIHGEARREGGVRPSTVVELATLSLLLLLATSKVFSIQYVVWLVPLAALLRGGRFWLAAAIVALTMPIHPLLYERLVNLEPMPILVLNVRNALLLALLAWMLWGTWRGRDDVTRGE